MSATRFTMANRCECVKSHKIHMDICYKAGECICSPCECDCHYVLPMRRIAGQSPALFSPRKIVSDGYIGLGVLTCRSMRHLPYVSLTLYVESSLGAVNV